MNPPLPAPPALESFWDYREHFKRAMRASHAREAAESESPYDSSRATPLNERLIQAIWASQLLQADGLRLADGRPLRVIEPGRWNGAAGPDFKGARLIIGSDEAIGDVEVHLAASDWRAHRHEADLDYNGVILHAVFQIDDALREDRLHNGSAAPRLELEPYLFPDLETIRKSITPDDYPYDRPPGLGKCHELMASSDPALAQAFLDRAGDERLKAKIRRLDEQAAGADLEQVFYQSLLLSLGVGSGKPFYYLLAKRAPIAQVADYVRELDEPRWRLGIESLLLHVAGLVPAEEEMADAPEESREYRERLAELWRKFEPYWSDRAIAPTRRWYRGIRPPNFPPRRLGAVAGLLARCIKQGRPPLAALRTRMLQHAGSLEGAKPAKRLHPAVKDLAEWFEVDDASSFWATHYSFTAKPAAKPMSLLGESTARTLLFNAALPALALAARRDGDPKLAQAAQTVFAIFPPLQENHVTEFMSRRLFGEGPMARDLATTERRRQGLFQIFYSCCNGEERTCDLCYYLANE